MTYSQHCEGCPLHGTGVPVSHKGSTLSRFVVVTDTPSQYNAREGRLLSNSASTVLGKAMKAAGFERDDFCYYPQVRCPHEADQYSTKEKKAIRDHCRPHMVEFVQRVKPEAVIPLGAEASRQVLSRAAKITKVRGVVEHSDELDTHVFPMLSPGMVTMYPQHQQTFYADCRALSELCDVSFNLRVRSRKMLGRYEFIDDLQFLIDMEPTLLFFDTENTGLSWFHEGKHDVRDYDPHTCGKEFDPAAAILTMQFTVKAGESYMLVWDHPERPASPRAKAKLRKQLRRLLCNPKTRVISQNAKYDATYMAGVEGIDYRIGGCTLMLATLLDENSLSRSQDTLVRQWVPEMAGYADHFNATTDKSRMWEVPLDKLINYGCGDADSGFRLYKKLIKEVSSDKRLLDHYRYVSLPGLNTFKGIELRGMDVDEDALDAFETLMDGMVTEQYSSLIEQVPRSIKRKHLQEFAEKKKKPEDALKFSRAEFVRDILFTHRDGFRLRPKVFTKTTAKLSADKRIPSTSTKDHLPYFHDDCPFTIELSEYIKNERLLNTSVRGFKKKYIHAAKVRPTYSLTTARTGRTSSEDPNGQNFPKRGKMAKAYRRCFVAPEGYYVLEADLSQAELRISADEANETTMLKVYREGGDIHTETATIVMGLTKAAFLKLPVSEQKDARQKAKAVNFGFIYGMGWRKFIGYAKTQYGVEFTDDEAQRIRSQFFIKYSKLEAWHEKYRNMARRDKQVRSYSGRIRHLPMIDSEDEMVQQEAGRQAINSPVQEFASSLGVMAMSRLSEEIDPRYLAPIAFVHDAIYCLVPKQHLEWGAKTLKWYMETNPIEEWFGIRMKCPIVADVSFGINFGDTFELKGLTLDEPYDFSVFSAAEDDDAPYIEVVEQADPPNYGLIEYD